MRQNPFHNAAMFLIKTSWLTVPFWRARYFVGVM
jgi:hypothetical protein